MRLPSAATRTTPDPVPRPSWPGTRHTASAEDEELLFTLTAIDEGCRLELVNYLSTQGGAARNAAGWEMCLDQLTRAVSGTPGSGAHEATMDDFRPVLERYKAAGLPDDGWLPDAPDA